MENILRKLLLSTNKTFENKYISHLYAVIRCSLFTSAQREDPLMNTLAARTVTRIIMAIDRGRRAPGYGSLERIMSLA